METTMKIIIRATLLLAVIAAAAGCATQQQQQQHTSMFCVAAGAPTEKGLVRGLLCMPIDPETELVPMYAPAPKGDM
jgi:hypothetical protein